MTSVTIGLLHPGEMGAALGAELVRAGHQVRWAGAGRGAATRARAEAAGLSDAVTVAALVADCHWLVSVCPPDAALAVAQDALAAGFRGNYLDANAISPSTSGAIAALVTAAGGRYVDGGIVGPPPTAPGRTRLFLSGPSAPDAAALVVGTNIEPVALAGEDTAASAVKMAYAAWTKGSMALLLAADALAARLGVGDALHAEWARSQAGLADRLGAARASATAKGWRWRGEMDEIAAACAAVDLPAGFHQAAAAIFNGYERPE